jgi:hypothetical protein
MAKKQERSGQSGHYRVFGWPKTKLGWWAVGLTAAFLALLGINMAVFVPVEVPATLSAVVLPAFVTTIVLTGIAGGIVALLAVILRHERSLVLWICMLIGLFLVGAVLLQVLSPQEGM